MRHMKGMTLLMNPLVNSYKRLVPGYEAPIYIAWSGMNRSPLIRIPSSRGRETRIELRSPDSASNPYLIFAVCLAAGLDGIRNQIMPPEAVDKNVFDLDEEELKRRELERLPKNLGEAIEELKKDIFIQGVLGEHVYRKYIEAKEREWTKYQTQISEWELEEYLYKI